MRQVHAMVWPDLHTAAHRLYICCAEFKSLPSRREFDAPNMAYVPYEVKIMQDLLLGIHGEHVFRSSQ